MKYLCAVVLLAVVALASAQAPPEWTCQDVIYGGDDACDCACGAYDPDCDTISFVRGCDEVEGSVYFCDSEGVCNYVVREVPASWHCEDIDYNNGDGICNCGCGAVDPDCGPGATVAECHNGLQPTCSDTGSCEYGAPLPDGWVCSGYAYDTQDGCDCSCGIPDPDCENQSEVFGCPCAEMSCVQGYCEGFCEGRLLYVTDATAARDVVEVEHCPIEERYRIDHASLKMPGVEVPESNSDLPFFDRNHINREVHETTIKRYIHTSNPDAHVKNMLKQWGIFDPEQTDVISIPRRKPMMARASRATPPPEWTCDVTYYDTLDGCDCNCGAPDPDCETQFQTVYGCRDGIPEGDFRPSCTPEGTCTFTEIVIPDDWRCDPDYYAYQDGCDCQCGAYDPDCDQSEAIVFNCNKGYDPICTADSVCTYLTPIPEGWTCPFFYYEDGDCDCNCGAQDTADCATPEAPILGCGQCTDSGTMSCEEGLCVGECNGIFLSFEKLDYWNALLQPGAPDVELIEGFSLDYSELYSTVSPGQTFTDDSTFFISSDDSSNESPQFGIDTSSTSDSTFEGGRASPRDSSKNSGALLSVSFGVLVVLAIVAL